MLSQIIYMPKNRKASHMHVSLGECLPYSIAFCSIHSKWKVFRNSTLDHIHCWAVCVHLQYSPYSKLCTKNHTWTIIYCRLDKCNSGRGNRSNTSDHTDNISTPPLVQRQNAKMTLLTSKFLSKDNQMSDILTIYGGQV